MTVVGSGPRFAPVHELSIAQSILDTVVVQTEDHGAARILRIHLRIGALTAIVDDALRFAFEAVSQDTCAQGAAVEIEHIPWTIRCRGCGHEYLVAEDLPTCPRCEGVGGETIAGRELQIVEMDVE